MNLYLFNTDRYSYDDYNAAIVAANTEEEAILLAKAECHNFNTTDDLTVEVIGVAKEDTEAGIILASFNAG